MTKMHKKTLNIARVFLSYLLIRFNQTVFSIFTFIDNIRSI